jgi:hypothetical protein
MQLAKIILLATILYIVYFHIKKESPEEKIYRENFVTAGLDKLQVHIPSQAYFKLPVDNFQLNQVYDPFYNFPKYIGKYPYYRYVFNTYNSRVYYT